MARPKKDASEKRDKRLTLYLTQAEEEQLNATTDRLKQDKTKFCLDAIREHLEKYSIKDK